MPHYRLSDLIPRFEAPRGSLRFLKPPMDGDSIDWDAIREREAKAARRRAWERRRDDNYCLCRYTTISNGDLYEDERHRSDNEACPVHGRRQFDSEIDD